jgi:uncharacterized protein
MGPAATRDIAAQSGGWLEVKRGRSVRIIDIEGAQVADMFAVSTADKTEWLSVGNTRSATERLFPKVGQSFYTNRLRPILTLEEDRTPGVHDMLYRACDPLVYALMGVTGHHPSCEENFQKVAVEVGWHPPDTPDPVNFFQNTPADEHGNILSKPALTKAGDFVTLRAEMDLIIVVTACSWDIASSPINGACCTGIRLAIVHDGDSG